MDRPCTHSGERGCDLSSEGGAPPAGKETPENMQMSIGMSLWGWPFLRPVGSRPWPRHSLPCCPSRPCSTQGQSPAPALLGGALTRNWASALPRPHTWQRPEAKVPGRLSPHPGTRASCPLSQAALSKLSQPRLLKVTQQRLVGGRWGQGCHSKNICNYFLLYNYLYF